MIKKRLFTVVLPAYNVENFLESALLSVIKQSCQNFEIIAVNDGSTDKTAEILSKWQQRESRITVIEQSNQGLSAARNRGVIEANGDYILFLDSDDELEKEALSTLETLITKHKPDIVAYSLRRMNESGALHPVCPTLHQPATEEPFSGEYFFRKQIETGHYLAMAPSYLCKKELLRVHNLLFDIGFVHEDEGFTPRALCLAGSVISTDKMLYRYRIRNDSIMTCSISLHHVKGCFKAASSLFLFSKTIENSETRKALLIRAEALVKEACHKLDTLPNGRRTYLPLYLEFFSLQDVTFPSIKLLFRLSVPKLYQLLKTLKHGQPTTT